ITYSFRRGLESSECRVVLSRGLPDRGTHDDLKDLVLAETRCPGRGDVFVGDLVSMVGDLVNQCAQRLGEARAVGPRPAAGGAGRAAPFRHLRGSARPTLCVSV